ncbi:phage tail sheath family protein [Paenibacillus sp. FSL H8-0034]|uniref:phage tail sheath family protein n=1 Tax=Paenibacillus sp. FSL H8-0034 TaxID=2954671 RepID=UPI0030F52BD3
MAGGTWVTQNKVRPGTYINIVGQGGTAGSVGDRGTVAMALSLSWGPSKSLLKINAGDDITTLLGYDLTAPSVLLVKETLKRAKTLLLYRLNAGTKAAVTTGTLTATAKHGGVRGNNLTVVIQTNVDDNAKFDVITLLAGVEVNRQVVSNIAGLVSNDWIVFSGSGTLATTAGAPLVSGADGTVTNSDHTDFLATVELYDFNTIAYTGTASDLKALYTAFIKRLRDDEGKKVQLVLENYATAGFEGVVSVKNGVKLSDGTLITAAQATAWVAAATAAAQMNQSLTYDNYDDAVDVGTRYTNAQIEAAILAGEFLFTPNQDKAKVEIDINTFTGFTPTKGKKFSKNRVIRVLDGIANDFKLIFDSFYGGKVDNNSDGRDLLWNEYITYLKTLQGLNALQNVDSATDVKIIQGAESDSVYVEVAVQPVDSVEKVYMKVTVR